MVIETASKVGTFCIIVVLIVSLAVRRGNTEQVVTRWQCSVASGEALVMLNQDVHSVLHRRTAMAIKMARGGGTFVRPHHLFRLVVQRLSSPLRQSSQSQISC